MSELLVMLLLLCSGQQCSVVRTDEGGIIVYQYGRGTTEARTRYTIGFLPTGVGGVKRPHIKGVSCYNRARSRWSICSP